MHDESTPSRGFKTLLRSPCDDERGKTTSVIIDVFKKMNYHKLEFCDYFGCILNLSKGCERVFDNAMCDSD